MMKKIKKNLVRKLIPFFIPSKELKELESKELEDKEVEEILFTLLRQFLQGVAELILRVVVGFFMLTSHGWGKLFSFSEKSQFFPDPLGIGSFASLTLATFAEFFCSILLILGLFTRFAAFNLLITMLVAGLIFHATDPFAKKELALLYALVFLYFTKVGGNRYSLDQWFRK
ncbi:MAG: DoxX family protein [Bdellovibrionales bacterium]|nr:DoxX family protein [Bdellovibrionales bacterium]